MNTIYTFPFVLIALTCLPANAQFDRREAPPRANYQPTPLLPAEFGFSQHHSSTAGEGYLRGHAAWVHAQGNYQVNRSQAAILAEQARWLAAANKQRKIELHQWKRELQASRQQAKRVRNEAVHSERYRVAYELSGDQLDRQSGRIVWPGALRSSQYEESRDQLEQLFRKLSSFDQPPRDLTGDVEHACEQLSRELSRNRAIVPAREYLASQKFLRGLKYEPLFRSQVF